MAEHILLKLASGEEVVTQYEIDDDGEIKATAPRQLIMQPSGQGQMGIAIIPYSAGNPDGVFTIHLHAIMSRSEAPEKLVKAYIENTTNIQIVSG